MKRTTNSLVNFFDKQEELLNQALNACQECQKQLAECLTTMESLSKENWPLSKEQKEGLEKIKNEFTTSFDSFKNAFIDLLTGGEHYK